MKLKNQWEKKWVRLLFITVLGLLLMGGFTGAVLSERVVVITDRDSQTIAFTQLSDPAAILENEGYTLSEHDEYRFSGFTEGKATIEIDRANLLQITADGKVTQVYTCGGTVGEALASAGIGLRGDDLINFRLSQPVDHDMEVVINRVTTNTYTTEKEIPFETEYVPTRNLKDGKTRTISDGKNGVLTTTVHQTLIDGEVVEEKILSEEVTVEPVAAQVFRGDSTVIPSQHEPPFPIELDENGNPVHYIKKVVGKATAYSALGKPTLLRPGAVAMNLKEFPRYTKLYIKTPDNSYVYGYSVVKDTGTGMIEGTVLVDLFFNSYLESVLFGAKTVEVYVLEWGNGTW